MLYDYKLLLRCSTVHTVRTYNELLQINLTGYVNASAAVGCCGQDVCENVSLPRFNAVLSKTNSLSFETILPLLLLGEKEIPFVKSSIKKAMVGV